MLSRIGSARMLTINLATSLLQTFIVLVTVTKIKKKIIIPPSYLSFFLSYWIKTSIEHSTLSFSRDDLINKRSWWKERIKIERCIMKYTKELAFRDTPRYSFVISSLLYARRAMLISSYNRYGFKWWGCDP